MRELRAEFDEVAILFWDDHELPVRARDLSSVGMTLVGAEAPVPDGAPVSVLFQLPDEDRFFRIDGSLARDGSTCDIQFGDLCDEIRDRLEAFAKARALSPVDVPTLEADFDFDEESTRPIDPGMLAALRRDTRPAADPPAEGGAPRWG